MLRFGTGMEQRFPPFALTSDILMLGVGLEVMSTAAAGRSFNVLASE